MHPRNCYKHKLNLQELATEYPELKKYDQKMKYDKQCQKEMKRILCKRDFKLDLTIPENHSITPLPMCIDYILWIEDLVSFDNATSSIVYGIDIGTGATCIHPLLSTQKNGWNFIATAENELSFQNAKNNVVQNATEDSITVIKTEHGQNVLTDICSMYEDQTFEFCMCNAEDLGHGTQEQTISSTSVAQHDYGFAEKIVRDSVHIRQKIRIYTVILHQLLSYHKLNIKIMELMPPITSITTTKFCYGETVRWAIAWTFVPDIVLTAAVPVSLGKPINVSFKCPAFQSLSHQDLKVVIEEEFRNLKLWYKIMKNNKSSCTFLIVANETTWISSKCQSNILSNKEKIENGQKQNTNKRPLEYEKIIVQSKQAKFSRDTDIANVYQPSLFTGLEPAIGDLQSGCRTNSCAVYLPTTSNSHNGKATATQPKSLLHHHDNPFLTDPELIPVSQSKLLANRQPVSNLHLDKKTNSTTVSLLPSSDNGYKRCAKAASSRRNQKISQSPVLSEALVNIINNVALKCKIWSSKKCDSINLTFTYISGHAGHGGMSQLSGHLKNVLTRKCST